jgi:hypothetical protein
LWRDSGSSGHFHGFLLDSGVYTSIDVPGSNHTSLTGINDSGQIIGTYFVNGVNHAFIVVPETHSTRALGTRHRELERILLVRNSQAGPRWRLGSV